MLIYAVYALFLVFALTSFGDLIGQGFVNAPPPSGNWVAGGITYASYNIVGAVIILPVLRHLTSQRDAVVAGMIAGPLTMLPARSEEHTSELQSLMRISYAVFCLKKKKTT